MQPALDRTWPWLLALVLLVSVAGQFNHDLWTPDEPREAAIILEMSRSGDFVVPLLAGVPFVEKPPVYYVMGALLHRALGDLLGSLNTMRLLNVLLAWATLWFTWLLACELGSRDLARWSILVLATLPGFIANFHWLRVDPALALFMVAAVWGLAAGYRRGRRGPLMWAGVFAAGAFLAKGLIGPVLLFFAWMPLMIDAWRRRDESGRDGFWWSQGAALVCFLLPALAWMLALRLHTDGEALWDEWFWQNHVGRLSGSATDLGHIKPGQYSYYLPNLVVYALPWLPAVLWRGWQDVRALWINHALPTGRLMLWIWLLGSLLLLSLATTKRALYLLPLLPGFALLAGSAMLEARSNWLRWVALIWAGLASLILLAIGLTPQFISVLADRLPGSIVAELSLWNMPKFAALAIAAGIGWLGWHQRREAGSGVLTVASTGLLFLAVLTIAVPVIDLDKSMAADTRALLEKIPPGARPRIGGWNLKETETSILYFYGDWSVPQLESADRVRAILAGQDPDFDGVLINKIEYGDTGILHLAGIDDAPPHQIIAEGHPRADKRRQGLYWVVGVSGSGDQIAR